MKIIRVAFIPKNYAVCIFNMICARDVTWIDRYVVNHERIHMAQQKEMLWIPFYIIYIGELAVKVVWHRSFKRGYMNVSFEREAYRHGHDLGYLSSRKHYAQYRKEKG